MGDGTSNATESAMRSVLAKVMIYGVLLAAAIMLIGGVVYVTQTPGAKPGDHVFHGEPADLRGPVAIFTNALRGHTANVIQLGVLILLFNPLIRVAFSAIGFAAQRDPLYTTISAAVFTILVVSYFV